MTLVVLCLAAFAIVTYCISAGVGLALAGLEVRLDRLSAAARARVYLSAALFPLLASAAILTAALAPSFGWIADHCGAAAAPHLHPHICAAHQGAVWPGLPLLLLAFAVSVRFLVATIGHAHALFLGAWTRRGLDRASAATAGSRRVRVLPVDEAQAFVLGLLRPTIYITRGLTSGPQRGHLDAVLAHERAHLARRDPLRRFVAGIALAFHLPGIAGRIDRALSQAQELAADEAAARSIGSRGRVAGALVALAKARPRAPQGALAFVGSEVETRVVQLMDTRPRSDSPTSIMLGAVATLALFGLAAGVDGVHHAVESLLGAISN